LREVRRKCRNWYFAEPIGYGFGLRFVLANRSEYLIAYIIVCMGSTREEFRLRRGAANGKKTMNRCPYRNIREGRYGSIRRVCLL